MHKIDSLNIYNDEWSTKASPFVFFLNPQYKNRDEHFLNFITDNFPAWISKIEGVLSQSGGKYLFGDSFTTADCSIGSIFLKLVWNDHFEHNLILQAVVNKSPKIKAYAETIRDDFKDMIDKY